MDFVTRLVFQVGFFVAIVFVIFGVRHLVRERKRRSQRARIKQQLIERFVAETHDPTTQLYEKLADFRQPQIDTRTEAEAVLHEAIAMARYLGIKTPREAAELLRGRGLTDEEWTAVEDQWNEGWRKFHSAH